MLCSGKGHVHTYNVQNRDPQGELQGNQLADLRCGPQGAHNILNRVIHLCYHLK